MEEKSQAECCNIHYFRKLLTFYNGIFLLSGLALAALSLWTMISHAAFLAVIPSLTYKIIVYLTLATSALIVLASLWGLLSLKLTWKSFTFIYLSFVVLAWMSQLITGLLSYAYIEEARMDLSSSLVQPLTSLYSNDMDFTQHIDFIQSRLKCCGANSPEDWNSSQWRLSAWSNKIEAVPSSCCKTPSRSSGGRHRKKKHCGLRIHPSSISFTGCVHPISQHIENRLLIFASVTLGFSVMQLLGIPFILGLLCKLYERDTSEKRQILLQDVRTSRFTRNQHQFNILKSQEMLNVNGDNF